MMRPKSIMLLALALGCGLIASIGISQVLDGSRKPAAVETVTVCVAAQNIPQGEPVTEAVVTLQEWPKDKVPAGALATMEEVSERRPRTMIFEGEPLLDSKLLAKGEVSDPIRGLPRGMRLKTISVDARKSAAGLISPGTRVDVQVFVRRNTNEGIDAPFTKIFLQNIQVYAVDQSTSLGADGTEDRATAKTVSLVVTPEQANRITLAENLGEIALIPRNPGDEAIITDADQGLGDLLNPNKPKEVAATAAPGGEGGLAALMQGFMAATAAKAGATPANDAQEPFKMTIIYPTEVEQVEFFNGEPVRRTAGDGGEQPLDVGSRVFAPPPQPAGGEGAGGGVISPPPKDFPIDLNRR
jgi:pilus assembly protein CpaB